MRPWQTKSSDIVYETPWIKVRRDQVLSHTAKPLTYSVIEAQHPSVFIVALDNENKILLEYHYRYTVDKMSWELPAGHADGDAPLVAAKRELLEETGFQSEEWTDLGIVYQAIGIGNLPMHVFLARRLKQTGAMQNEDGEAISELRFFSISQIDAMIKKGEIISAGEIAAYCIAKQHIDERSL